VPVVDIVEIGAGGGSIAHIGPSGELRVGPESAGADPGPACYARGGTRPTVTDAKLLTGAIDPERFAGGRMRLDRSAAERAFEAVAKHLGTSVIGAAEAAIRLAEANMINALKLVTIQRGHDPRDLTMVVSGGGGPMHAATLGRELGVKRTVIPRHVGLFSAWGMLSARPRLDLRQTSFSTLDAATPETARALFGRLEAEAAEYFGAGPDTPLVFDRQIEMRYVGQEHAVATPFDPEAGLDVLREAFHARHEQTYTFRLPDTEIELVTYHLAAELDTPRVGLPEIAPDGSLEAALIGDLAVSFGENGGEGLARVYDRERLPPGAVLTGPVLIEEATATTMVLPGQRASVDRFGLVMIEEAR
jgi:N-methylhydantoinase A